ncbi:SusD family protein [Pedobacter steynii]|uniref:SusD family protein n=1 Tax=Pedobacter steynii TaxID=430522 RepID=A0A1G9K8F0_9SPHI|nr:RagB/SusD family nutrient uptake outer membrane protein [Pedobacter steynii]NQX38477.1 RagB/SusD family nutrient uptake outer membrane protein [Pedobacter steynii]SDL45912.1 SusD family protein [Pedobacter steynii]
MKNYIIKILTGLVCIVGATGCKKYLDVKPNDKFLESQVFSTENGVKTALNGVYVNMAGPNLYGGNLTMSTLDVMAQRYNLSAFNHNWAQYAAYNYNDARVVFTMDNIWSTSYKQILNLNIFISQLNNSPGVLSVSKASLLKGEAYGLRAMLHLDLLRLFGPVYSTSPTALSIPYYTKAQTQSSGSLPANVVMEKILSDLDTAATLLANDPIILDGKQTVSAPNDADVFYKYRNMHMNYYAVRALQARANLYAGNKQKALSYAAQVITEASKWFTWTNDGQAITPAYTDRKFSSEVLFGLQNLDIYKQFDVLFRYDVGAANLLAPHKQRLSGNYSPSDFRYISWFRVPPSGTSDFSFFKFESVIVDSEDFRRFFQPLIRISEMYYIAAESHTDPSESFKYLNTVLKKRGLQDLPLTANLQNEIQNEYVREFFGEGQLFYYYKRRALTAIPNGSAASGNLTVSAQQYVVPIPESESGR